ncbi:hypothetical protein LQ327_22625 [Actinomycetospora endophytica]|uniref:Lipoprotein n=1 Tax=Actinomycetospora endophytica TaxID=2291215 RepID=A0ABS8PD26_9PSEU|nr:hypothetical protein [Actinomycetospora endophytica]MCD2196172.1 hypothetical protein [Actinomycetospora endophytica]
MSTATVRDCLGGTHMKRGVRAAVVAATCAAGLTLTACASGGAAASASLQTNAFTAWLEEAARVADEGVPEGRVIAESKPLLDAPAGVRPADLDHLLQSAPPPTVDPQVAPLVRTLKARQAATTLAASALTADNAGGAAIDATAAASTQYPQVEADLQTVGRDVVKDIACNALLDQLQPSEQQEAENAGEPAWVQIGAPTVQAIETVTAKRFSPEFGGLVEWSTWGYGIGKDADDIVSAAANTATTPDATHAPAFYYYVRICLAPPS